MNDFFLTHAAINVVAMLNAEIIIVLYQLYINESLFDILNGSKDTRVINDDIDDNNIIHHPNALSFSLIV